MADQLGNLGVNTDNLVRSRSQVRKRTRSQIRESESTARTGGDEGARGVSVSRNRSASCFRNVKQKVAAEKIRKLDNRGYLFTGQRGEADREILNTRPKHLMSGKRGIGSTSRR
jgi:nucleolar GTP-binding protein